MPTYAYMDIGMYMAWKQRSITGGGKEPIEGCKEKIMSGECEKIVTVAIISSYRYENKMVKPIILSGN